MYYCLIVFTYNINYRGKKIVFLISLYDVKNTCCFLNTYKTYLVDTYVYMIADKQKNILLTH